MKAFPQHVADVPEEEDEVVELFLWESNIEVFDVYKILRNYLTEYYGIDSAILLALIQDKKAELSTTLEKIPYIHSGYISVVSDKKET